MQWINECIVVRVWISTGHVSVCRQSLILMVGTFLSIPLGPGLAQLLHSQPADQRHPNPLDSTPAGQKNIYPLKVMSQPSGVLVVCGSVDSGTLTPILNSDLSICVL